MSAREEEPRKCYRCGEVKRADAFAWRRRGKLQRDSFCRPCRKEYGREHYLANKQRYADQARLTKQRLARERMGYLLDYFATHPCCDCGETDPLVLEFDHLRDKQFNISTALGIAVGPAFSRRSRNARWYAPTATDVALAAGSAQSASCWFTASATSKRVTRIELVL